MQGAGVLLCLSVRSPSWSKEEKSLFNEAILLHGKDWIKVSAYVGTRSVITIRSYARLFRKELEEDSESKH